MSDNTTMHDPAVDVAPAGRSLSAAETTRRAVLMALPTRSVAEQDELNGLNSTRPSTAAVAVPYVPAARPVIDVKYTDAVMTAAGVARASSVVHEAILAATDAVAQAHAAADRAEAATLAGAPDAAEKTAAAEAAATKASSMTAAASLAEVSLTAATAYDVAVNAATVAMTANTEARMAADAAGAAGAVDAAAKSVVADAAEARAVAAVETANKAALDAHTAETAAADALAAARAPMMAAMSGDQATLFGEMKAWVRAELALMQRGHSEETRMVKNP